MAHLLFFCLLFLVVVVVVVVGIRVSCCCFNWEDQILLLPFLSMLLLLVLVSLVHGVFACLPLSLLPPLLLRLLVSRVHVTPSHSSLMTSDFERNLGTCCLSSVLDQPEKCDWLRI